MPYIALPKIFKGLTLNANNSNDRNNLNNPDCSSAKQKNREQRCLKDQAKTKLFNTK